MRKQIAVMLPLLLAACAAPPGTPVPVRGDAEMLAGHWSGEYTSNETGRSGSILFTLKVGSDTATGDVLMIPNWPGPYSISQYIPPEDYVSPTPEPLRIQLVRVFGHQVAGQLTPYKDPDCGCVVTTIFSGRLEGNKLEGVFHSYHPDGRTTTGEWRVQRKLDNATPRE
jgi:hypothetical protein